MSHDKHDDPPPPHDASANISTSWRLLTCVGRGVRGQHAVDARLKVSVRVTHHVVSERNVSALVHGPAVSHRRGLHLVDPGGILRRRLHSGAVQPLLDLRARSLTQASAPGPVRAVVAQRLQQLSHRCAGGQPGGFPHLLGRGAGRPHEESAVVVSVRRKLALAERVALLRHQLVPKRGASALALAAGVGWQHGI